MKYDIDVEVKAFEALQATWRHAGAADTEPSAIFRKVMHHARLSTGQLDWDSLDWELYDRKSKANALLTKQAKRVYAAIVQKLAEDTLKRIPQI